MQIPEHRFPRNYQPKSARNATIQTKNKQLPPFHFISVRKWYVLLHKKGSKFMIIALIIYTYTSFGVSIIKVLILFCTKGSPNKKIYALRHLFSRNVDFDLFSFLMITICKNTFCVIRIISSMFCVINIIYCSVSLITNVEILSVCTVLWVSSWLGFFYMQRKTIHMVIFTPM